MNYLIQLFIYIFLYHLCIKRKVVYGRFMLCCKTAHSGLRLSLNHGVI